MAGFTKTLRQEIVREFAIRHNGHYNPNLFVEEVRRTGPSHAAYAWFEWDQRKAANAFQVEQAREFARDLRVSFTVEEIGKGRKVSVREIAMPMVLSPMDGRKAGGGYVLTDPNDPSHMAEHCLQGATALRAWWVRYSAAALHAGCTTSQFDEMLKKLDAASPAKAQAA